MSAFEDLGLRAELLRAVSDEGYATPTPIQARSIPTVLAGRDLMAAAQTGTDHFVGRNSMPCCMWSASMTSKTAACC